MNTMSGETAVPPPVCAECAEDPPSLRPATPADVDSLVVLENRAFPGDRLSRRSFRRFAASSRASLLVLEEAGGLCGYVLVLYRRGTALARLYSIAVDPACGGRGFGGRLLAAAEQAAFARGAAVMRLEARPDNAAALGLYRKRGYRQFGMVADYYEDHAAALRFQKWLIAEPPVRPGHPVVPYYQQSTEFTCGPAAMMMAMAAFVPQTRLDRRLELRLWREATTIFMAAGLGGCEPVGMAVALARHGFAAEVFVNSREVLFLDSVRDAEKRAVMAVAQEDFRDQAKALKVPVRARALSPEGLRAALDAGAVVLVLVSQYRMLRFRAPHWVAAFAHADSRIFIHDPWVEADDHETPLAAATLPIPEDEFDRMACYGKARLRAAIVIKGKRTL
ncbi:GNAT family N-acetyltransferase/peptidase C39 family protein [Oleispirillum naphthae]|uniref:GNAT family N-acetyltransferase/peptidase C39 family protein n=1 Tax=Oleispirillum naphthae TaxID=2838853 RepID=UPI0030825EBF